MGMNSDEAWVTIAEMSWLAEAQVLKSFLQSQGLEAFIPEEFISTINPMVTAVRVRVQVRESSVEEAKKLLQEFSPEAAKPKCSHCGSEDLRFKPIGIKGWLMLLACLLIVVPMKGPGRKYCKTCGRDASS